MRVRWNIRRIMRLDAANDARKPRCTRVTPFRPTHRDFYEGECVRIESLQQTPQSVAHDPVVAFLPEIRRRHVWRWRDTVWRKGLYGTDRLMLWRRRKSERTFCGRRDHQISRVQLMNEAEPISGLVGPMRHSKIGLIAHPIKCRRHPGSLLTYKMIGPPLPRRAEHDVERGLDSVAVVREVGDGRASEKIPLHWRQIKRQQNITLSRNRQFHIAAG